MNSNNFKTDKLLRREVLFPFFLRNIDTGLVYLSDDLNARVCGKYAGKMNMDYDQDFLSLSAKDRLFYLCFNYKNVEDIRLKLSEYELNLVKCLNSGKNPKFFLGLSLLLLVKNNSRINIEEIKLIEITGLSLDERFILEILYFRYYNFINIDFKKSYLHLLKAEKIYDDFSQLYALKVRTLYFMYFECCSTSEKTRYRKNFLNMDNHLMSEIKLATLKSHEYRKNNSGIVTFQIAYYLHSYDKRGIIEFFKHSERIKNFKVQQRYTICLWIGKYFMRKAHLRQSYYYLYRVSETLIKKKKLDIDMIIARVHLAVRMGNRKDFDININILKYEMNYISNIVEHNSDGYYVNKESEVHYIMSDNLLLPILSTNYDKGLFGNIDSDLFSSDITDIYPLAILFYKRQ